MLPARRSVLLLLVAVVLGCAAPTAAKDWQEYRAWVQSGWVVELAEHMAIWNASANAGEAQITGAARLLIGDLDPAIAWLDAHPPQPCYASAHRLNRQWMAGMRNSLARLLDAAAARDSGVVMIAMGQMAQALEVRRQAGLAHEAVRC